MGGQVVVRDGMVTTAYHCFKIDLAPRAVAVDPAARRGRGDDAGSSASAPMHATKDTCNDK
jgi:hypothetical protein